MPFNGRQIETCVELLWGMEIVLIAIEGCMERWKNHLWLMDRYVPKEFKKLFLSTHLPTRPQKCQQVTKRHIFHDHIKWELLYTTSNQLNQVLVMAKILMEFNPPQEILYFLRTSRVWKNKMKQIKNKTTTNRSSKEQVWQLKSAWSAIFNPTKAFLHEHLWLITLNTSWFCPVLMSGVQRLHQSGSWPWALPCKAFNTTVLVFPELPVSSCAL